jgi:hypothetical protein
MTGDIMRLRHPAMKVAILCGAAALCHPEPPTPQAWARRRISRRQSFGGVICLILLSCKVAGSAHPYISEPALQRRCRVDGSRGRILLWP